MNIAELARNRVEESVEDICDNVTSQVLQKASLGHTDIIYEFDCSDWCLRKVLEALRNEGLNITGVSFDQQRYMVSWEMEQ